MDNSSMASCEGSLQNVGTVDVKGYTMAEKLLDNSLKT